MFLRQYIPNQIAYRNIKLMYWNRNIGQPCSPDYFPLLYELDFANFTFF